MTKHPPGEPMTVGNMRALGVRRLIASATTMLDANGVFTYTPAANFNV